MTERMHNLPFGRRLPMQQAPEDIQAMLEVLAQYIDARMVPEPRVLSGGVQGRARPIPATLTAGQPAPFVEIFSVDGSNRQAEAVTTFFQEMVRDDNQPFANADDQRIVARVTWGAGGQFSQAFIDVVRGSRFTVICNALRVELQQESTLINNPAMRCGAFAGYFPNGSVFAPTRTLIVPAVGGGGVSAFFQIPQFAIGLQVIRDPSASAIDVDFHTDVATAAISSEPLPAGAQFRTVRIPNDARFIRISATGAITAARLIFQLAL